MDRQNIPSVARVAVSPEKAAEVTRVGIDFLKRNANDWLEDLNKSRTVMPTVISSVLGVALAGAAFTKKLSKPWRWTAGIGAGVSGIYAGASYLMNGVSGDALNKITEVKTLLDKIEANPPLKNELIALVSQKIGPAFSPKGTGGMDDARIVEMILDFGRDKGMISPANDFGALTLSLPKNADSAMVMRTRTIEREEARHRVSGQYTLPR